MQTKKVTTFITIGALLIAGLFFVLKQKTLEGGDQINNKISTDDGASKNLSNTAGLKSSNSVLDQQSGEQSGAGNLEIKEQTSSEPRLDISKLNESERKLWTSFEEILKSKNDSDSRVNDLKNLSVDFKKALSQKYNSLKAEDRNARGFIVYLITKNIQTGDDFLFLQKVYQEQPCLSLADCTTPLRETDSHDAGIDDVTLSYPQLVALYQIEKKIESRPSLLNDLVFRAEVQQLLRQAETFSTTSVRMRAEQIKNKFKL